MYSSAGWVDASDSEEHNIPELGHQPIKVFQQTKRSQTHTQTQQKHTKATMDMDLAWVDLFHKPTLFLK